MQTMASSNAANYVRNFPPFSLSRLLKTVFAPKGGERICILIDLDSPSEAKDFAFLKNPDLTIQRNAVEVFYKGLKNGALAELGLEGGEMFAYAVTGGSNLDLPDNAVSTDGRTVRLVEDVYQKYDIVLCISTYSATAPLTAFAKKYGFRGATLHGVNQVILNSGLAVDYHEVSRLAEKLRLGMTRAESVEVDYVFEDKTFTLLLLLDGQEAQKSHGLCRGGPDIANLPAGEIYYVPAGAEGQFPMKYEDGTIGRMDVHKGRVTRATLLRGNQSTIDAHNEKLRMDPVTGPFPGAIFRTKKSSARCTWRRVEAIILGAR